MYQNQEKLTVTEVGVKAKSKAKVYRVTTTEGGICMSPLKELNYQYIKTLLQGIN